MDFPGPRASRPPSASDCDARGPTCLRFCSWFPPLSRANRLAWNSALIDASQHEFALATRIGQPSFRRFLPMISWIQRYFQHHFKVIFAVLLGLIIISFVFTIGAAPGIGQAERQVVDRYFFGYN